MARVLRALLVLTVLAASVLAHAEPGYRIVAHPDTNLTSVDKGFVAEAFLKKSTRWSDGRAIRPVDQDPDASTRRNFSEDVLGRSVGAVKSYWQQSIFSGRDVPPPELRGDEAVIAWVSQHPGAIGYVSAGANVRGVKVLTVR